jgi:hypothetical protein
LYIFVLRPEFRTTFDRIRCSGGFRFSGQEKISRKLEMCILYGWTGSFFHFHQIQVEGLRALLGPFDMSKSQA